MRQVSRFLDDMMRGASKEQIDQGLPLPSGYSGNHGKKVSSGRLFFQTRQLGGAVLPEILPGHGADNAILAQTLQLQREDPATRVTLVSKDINLRIKGAVLGVQVEDYYSDKTLEDSDVLYSGMAALPADFWENHGKDMRSWKEAERTFYEVTGPAVQDWLPNLGVYENADHGIEGIVRSVAGGTATLELTRDFRTERHNIWGVTARNREQNFALNLLMDPQIDLVTLLGPAGTGKTLLALAAGSRPDPGGQPFRRDHHDPGHHSAGRGYRLPAGYRGGKDGALDGRPHGQPRGPHPKPGGGQLGPAPRPMTCCATASRYGR